MVAIHKTNVEEIATNKPDAISAFNLNAAATQADGLRNFAAAYADTEQLPYFASDGAGLWESGLGTFTAGTPNTLVRNTIYESSNSNADVDFSEGGDVVLHVEWSADSANIAQKRAENLVVLTGDGGALQSINFGTVTKITGFKTILKDANSLWDAANNRFKPKHPGFYKINVHAQIRALSDQKYFYVRLYKNDVPSRITLRAYSGVVNSYIGSNNSVILDFNGTTDYIDVRVYHNDSVSARALYSANNQLNFSAEFISEL